MKKCSKCLIPETHETISFDNKGICGICRQHEYKQEKIDWKKKKEELRELIYNYKGKSQYDCIVPFSGGKDSTFTLYYLVKEFNIKPLVISFDHGFYRPKHQKLVISTLKKLGVDYLKFTPNWHLVREVMLESLKRKGDFCWHCHTGIFAYPMRIAIMYKTPLIFWGEKSSEYTTYYGYDDEEEVDEKRFNRFINLGITAEDMYYMLNKKFDKRDLMPFTYPKLKDLRKIKYKSVCLGSYIPWDVRTHSEIIKKELGWDGDKTEGIADNYWYEKVECYFQGIRDYLKYLKRGYGRTAHLVALDRRNNRVSVKEGKKIIAKYDGKRPASLNLFLKYIGISEEEFNNIALSHCVSPWKPDLKKIKKGKPLKDANMWDRTY